MVILDHDEYDMGKQVCTNKLKRTVKLRLDEECLTYVQKLGTMNKYRVLR